MIGHFHPESRPLRQNLGATYLWRCPKWWPTLEHWFLSTRIWGRGALYSCRTFACRCHCPWARLGTNWPEAIWNVRHSCWEDPQASYTNWYQSLWPCICWGSGRGYCTSAHHPDVPPTCCQLGWLKDEFLHKISVRAHACVSEKGDVFIRGHDTRVILKGHELMDLNSG